jgi:hypothetical protein
MLSGALSFMDGEVAPRIRVVKGEGAQNPRLMGANPHPADYRD